MRITKARDGSDSEPPSATACMASCSDKTNTARMSPPSWSAITPTKTSSVLASAIARRPAPSLDRLWEMIKNPSELFPLSDRPGLRCVLFVDWEKACVAPGAVSDAQDERERRRKFKGARTELERKQAITVDHEAERVYPTPKNERGGRGD